MTILQSDFAKGVKTVPSDYMYGGLVAYTADFLIPAGLTIATTDIVELAVLPEELHIVDAIVVPTGAFAGATADIGIMSGNVGSNDPARTSDTGIFAAAALTGFVRLAKADAILLAPSDVPRSIGVKFSAAITGAGQVLRVQFLMAR